MEIEHYFRSRWKEKFHQSEWNSILKIIEGFERKPKQFWKKFQKLYFRDLNGNMWNKYCKCCVQEKNNEKETINDSMMLKNGKAAGERQCNWKHVKT